MTLYSRALLATILGSLLACGAVSADDAESADADLRRPRKKRDAGAPTPDAAIPSIPVVDAGSSGGSDAGSPPPPVPDAGSACTLAARGPITASADGQIIENVKVTSTNGAAITVNGRSNVIIRNVEIHHTGGSGISFSNANNIRIENVVIVHDGAPASGPNSSDNRNNISGESSTGVVVTNARVSKGSSGIYLVNSPGAVLSFIEGHDIRGPFPRGQLVQFNKCSNSILQDFSVENPKATSWPEDNVSAFESSNITIQRGLIDGNNSPTGVGIMFEQSDGVTSGGKAIDVDAVRMGNGCFFAYPGRSITFQRTRCRDNICTSQGRGAPTSAGLAWGGSPESNNLQVLDSKHKNLCGGLAWDASRFNTLELTEQDFTLRAPQRLSFCWNPPAQ